MRDLSPRQQRNVATDIKKGLKETFSHCTMNQSHDTNVIPPSLQTPLTPTARTMQSPDLNTSPPNLDLVKKPTERIEDGSKGINASTIVSMATADGLPKDHKDTNHALISRQSSHGVSGNRHFDTEVKRVPNSASYMNDKNAALFHFDEFQSDKLNCNSSNNCATKTSPDIVLSPHNNPNAAGTPAQDNAHMSRTPSTNSTLSPISLPMEETGEHKPTNTSSRPAQQSGILENQIRIDEFDETEIKDLTNLANNSNSDSLDTDIISGFGDTASHNVSSTQGSNFLFSESADSMAGVVSQVTTAASTSPTVTTVTSSVPITTRTSTSMVSDISPSPFNEKSSFPSSITGPASSGSSPTTPFSPSSSSGKKSYLQNILGVTDTMKLQSLSKPVNSGHIPCPTTTSFSSNTLKSHSAHNQTVSSDSNSKTINLQQKSQMFHPSPQFMNRHGRNPNVTFQNQNVPSSNPNAMKNQQQMRQNMPYNNNDMSNHSRPPFLSRSDSHPYSPTTSGPNVWPQRGPSPSQTRSPPQFSGPMFNSKINPMTGLQCTVDSIPVSIGPGSTPPTPTVNSSNNMGPPLLSPSLQGGTPPPGRIRTPSLTSNGDKRCVSADGMLPSGTSNLSRAKERNKRERTKSADSKNEDDKKENSAPKSKRKKSRSKEDSGNKTPTRASKQSTLNILLDPKTSDPSQIYVYSSQIANKAADHNANSGTSFLLYHRSFISNERLTLSPTHQIQSEDTPKSTPTQPSVSNMTPVSGSPMTTSMSESQLPDVKTEPTPSTFMNGSDTPRSSHFSPKTSDVNAMQKMQALQRQSSQQAEEALSEEQRRHREEKLGKIQRLQHMLSSFPPNSEGSNNNQWDGNPPPQMRNPNIRGPVPKEGQINAEQEWNNLLQVGEHNNEKVRQMHQHVHPPPPYQHAPHRWPNAEGFDMARVPMHPEMNNPRFTRMNIPNRPRFAGEPMPRMPAGYQQRMSYRYMEPGPGPRHPMYDNYNIPGGNPTMPHPPNIIGPAPPRGQPQPRGPSSEIYPFSEQLARTASLYNREPGFDPAPNDPNIGPRMGSPDWNPGTFNNNIPGPESTQRLSHLPGANSSPIHTQMAPNVMNPTSMESMIMNPDQRPTGTPVTNAMETMGHPGMRMGAPYDMGPQRMPFANGEPMMNAMSSPTGPMRMPIPNHMPGSMNEAMARRGDQRPPDIPIPRSPNNYGVRASLPSPNVMASMGQRFSHPNEMQHGGHMGMMHPQQSPLAPNIPRSPGSAMMKSPMPQPQYGHMGPHSNSMDNNMIAPHSAGPMSAQPPDWGMTGAPTPGSRTPNMTSQAGLARSSGQSALSVMMNSVNNYKMSSAPLYQEAVSIKDTPHSPSINNPNEPPLSHEPPPLSHGVPPGGMPRNMTPRFPAFQESPVMNRMSPQAMHQRNMMPGMNIRNRSMPPGSISNNPNNSNFPQHYQPEAGGFDLKTILPRKDPSETISYFPPSAAGGDMPAMDQMSVGGDPQINNHPQMSSMNNRFPNMNMCNRPMAPGNHPYGHPMNTDRSPNCFHPMDNNYQPGMHNEPQMMENFNQNPNWSEGIRPQLMHSGDPMYSANRP